MVFGCDGCVFPSPTGWELPLLPVAVAAVAAGLVLAVIGRRSRPGRRTGWFVSAAAVGIGIPLLSWSVGPAVGLIAGSVLALGARRLDAPQRRPADRPDVGADGEDDRSPATEVDPAPPPGSERSGRHP